MAAASQIADGVMNWINKKGFTVDAVNSAAQKLGYDVNNLTRGQKGSITKLINEGVSNVSNATGRNNSKTSFNSIVRSIRKEGGAVQDIFNGMNPKSYASQDAYEQAVDSLWRNRNKISSASEIDPIMTKPVSELTPDELRQRRVNRGLDEKYNPKSGRQEEIEAAFGEHNIPKTPPEGRPKRDFNEVWNSMSDEQKAKWNDMKKKQKTANNEAYGLDEKHGYIPDADDMSNRSMTREEYNQKRKEPFDNSAEGKERAKIEKDQRREKAAQERQEKLRQEREMKQRASKETGGRRAEKQRKAYEERKRLEEFEDTKERGIIGMAFHKLGNGISAAFGIQNVKTNAAGEVVNEFAARNTIKTNMNAYNRYQAKTGGAKISSDDFMKGYGVFDEETLGNFSQRLGTMEQSSNFDGLGDWAKEHPFLVAGAIAGTTVGAASIIGNIRDGD